MKKKIICIIPARGKSKRIKNKNIKAFNGKPIIAWSIIAAKKSKIFDHIIVSTDSKKIANISKKYGAQVPYLRSSRLSNDIAPVNVAIIDAINFLKKKNFHFDFVCMIFPTSVFTIPKDLTRGAKLIRENKNLDFVVSLSKLKTPYFRALKVKKKKILPLFKSNVSKRSQELTELYYDNAQFTFGRVESWLAKKHSFLANSSFVYMPSYKVQDIDTLEDWKRAELLFKIQNKKFR